jgi:succinate-acetate transporter protein
MAHTRIVLRPIGSPLPLGLLALMSAGVLLSLQQIHALAVDQGRTIALILIAFVVPLQLLASVLGFLARDSVAGTAFGVLSGAWLATALVTLSSRSGATSPALGAFFFCLAVALVVLITGASFGKTGPAVVIVAAAVRFLVTGLYEITADTGLQNAAAIIGFALAVTALYAALATEVEDVRGALKLPLGRRAKARDALEGGFEEQLDGLEHEAGVRQQL